MDRDFAYDSQYNMEWEYRLPDGGEYIPFSYDFNNRMNNEIIRNTSSFSFNYDTHIFLCYTEHKERYRVFILLSV